MRFVLILLHLRLWHLDGVFGADEDEMKTLSVTEGDSVILHTGVAELRNNAVLQWMFGPENPDIIIAELNRAAMINNVSDERFRDRVKMDDQTGSLTFTNIRSTDTGLYKVEISTNPEADKMFRVTVSAFLSAPVIIRNTSKCSSSEGPSVSHCALLCSVVNVSAVSLSWYKGNSLISSISVFNVSTRLSLPLELQYEDNNTYSCVINNTISNKTEHLDIRQHCQPCAESDDASQNQKSWRNLIIIPSVLFSALSVIAAIGLVIRCADKKCNEVKEQQFVETVLLKHLSGSRSCQSECIFTLLQSKTDAETEHERVREV